MSITTAISEFSVLYTIPTVLNQSFKFLGESQGRNKLLCS